LQEKSVITRTVEAAGGVYAPGHLGELTQIVDFVLVDAVIEETGSREKRLRLLPSRVVVYFVLALALFEDCSYRGVWGKLTAGLEGLPLVRPAVSSLSRARRRIGAAPLRRLFEILAGPSITLLQDAVVDLAILDANAARDVLNHHLVRSHLSSEQTQKLDAVLTASGLGAGILSDAHTQALTSAVDKAEAALHELLSTSAFVVECTGSSDERDRRRPQPTRVQRTSDISADDYGI
jgi:hypothetical protein